MRRIGGQTPSHSSQIAPKAPSLQVTHLFLLSRPKQSASSDMAHATCHSKCTCVPPAAYAARKRGRATTSLRRTERRSRDSPYHAIHPKRFTFWKTICQDGHPPWTAAQISLFGPKVRRSILLPLSPIHPPSPLVQQPARCPARAPARLRRSKQRGFRA